MSAPHWQLRDTPPYWQLAEPRRRHRPWARQAPQIYRAVPSALELIERAGGNEAPFGAGDAVRDLQPLARDQLTFRGPLPRAHQPECLSKFAKESFGNIRAILSHGKDPSLGSSVLGNIASIREEADRAVARVNLFRSVPGL